VLRFLFPAITKQILTLRMVSMAKVLTTIFAIIAGGSVGALGLYLGRKLSVLRGHQKFGGVQTLFTRTNLDGR